MIGGEQGGQVGPAFREDRLNVLVGLAALVGCAKKKRAAMTEPNPDSVERRRKQAHIGCVSPVRVSWQALGVQAATAERACSAVSTKGIRKL